ncbi:hypothetical protein TSUD_148460 [Trifolium subterraneum]|uniref:Uncharacterized protein n=1 Tax=Trifolium subterraneum TaxID=3900 RepID=A0A2Z6MMF3_TRISU|nr:hypothetical protein TSUD_148460 [Trifolium subterraneum]
MRVRKLTKWLHDTLSGPQPGRQQGYREISSAGETLPVGGLGATTRVGFVVGGSSAPMETLENCIESSDSCGSRIPKVIGYVIPTNI